MRPILGFVFFTGILVACGGNDNNTTSVCGDGQVTGTEQCDDGNTVSGDGCSSTCHTEAPVTCGNGTVEVDKGEQCDDGNTVDGDGCSSTCQNEASSKCGNGMMDSGEACDDGNKHSGDGCSETCTVESGYTCTGTPSVCISGSGTCAAPYTLALHDNAGTLSGTGTGDTTASTDQVALHDCEGLDSGGANDHLWQFTIPDTRDVTVTITGTATAFDSELRVTTAACDLATAVHQSTSDHYACSDVGIMGDDEVLAFSALPAGTYYIVVDGYDVPDVGAYSFTVTAAPSTCGDGTLDLDEGCDDANATTPGCAANCSVELGYTCTAASPSVCTVACGNGALDAGEECDDGGTSPGDRCSPTCTLEYDVAEVEPNDTVAQVLTASHHVVHGSLTANDIDLYTFTLAVPSTVEIETYDAIDASHTYTGVSTLTSVACEVIDTQVRLFDSTGDVTMNATEKAFDDDDGDHFCSYIGPHDSTDVNDETTTMVADPNQGVLAAGTYTIKVTPYSGTTAAYYILDLKITSAAPTAPVAGDLVLNELMAADNTSDTNCDGVTTGTNDEFIELVNMSTKVLDLTGVTIADAVQVRHTFAAGATGSMTLNPGKAIVVWSGGAPACPGVTDWFVASTGLLSLNDAGDTITVKNAAGDTLIGYTYPAATSNKSFNLDPDARMLGTAYSLHDAVTGAVGAYSPGKHADGTAF